MQGSPLSPLLSKIVLDELDRELERRGLAFCRFADDCNIFVTTPKAAERVMAHISQDIETRLKLAVNREKSQVARSDRVKFLGFTIVGDVGEAGEGTLKVGVWAPWSFETAASAPETIFGAASCQMSRFLGLREMLSGSTSPNMRTSLVCS